MSINKTCPRGRISLYATYRCKDVHELLEKKDKEITKKDEQLWGAFVLFSQLAGQVVSSS
jgi:hypothetical protein